MTLFLRLAEQNRDLIAPLKGSIVSPGGCASPGPGGASRRGQPGQSLGETCLSRLVIVSNRVPLAEQGKQSGGGLVTGVLEALRETGGIWFGWSGEIAQTDTARPKVTEADALTYATVDLTREDYDGYYNGFCNAALWPLFHYRLDLVKFTRQDLAVYQRVNTLLATQLAPMLLPDDLVWVHDYHLIPMAENLRRAGATQRLGFFLHTPFPSFGVLAVLPHYKDLLESLCAYDLVGFQTIEDLTAFHDAIVRGAGGEVMSDGRVRVFGRELAPAYFRSASIPKPSLRWLFPG
jgi:trehalose 6-phosphate synthase